MDSNLRRAGLRVWLVLAAAGCGAVDQAVAPEKGIAGRPATEPSATVYTIDGHDYYDDNGELVPTSVHDATITDESTDLTVTCSTEDCRADYALLHDGRWHGTSHTLTYRVWNPATGVTYAQHAGLSLTPAVSCVTGTLCVEKTARTDYPVTVSETCRMKGNGSTLHAAWWGYRANINVGGVTFTYGSFGNVTKGSATAEKQSDACPDDECELNASLSSADDGSPALSYEACDGGEAPEPPTGGKGEDGIEVCYDVYLTTWEWDNTWGWQWVSSDYLGTVCYLNGNMT